MKLKMTVAALVLAFAGSAFGATATTDTINPSFVTDSSNATGWVAGNVSTYSKNIGNFTVSKYNGSGVLVGASFSALVGNETLEFTRGSGSGNPIGSAYREGTLSIAGVTATASSTNSSVTSVGKSGESVSNADYTVSGNATTQSQLNALYGSGTASGTVAERLYVDKTGSSSRSLTVDNSTKPTATVTYTYTAVNHATGGLGALGGPTGNTLNLSFGDVLAGTSPAAVGLDLYNLVGSYGLQIKSVVYQSGGSPLFSLGGIGTGTTNLAAGSSVAGTVGFAGSATAGAYSGTWLITVADSATGIGAGKNLNNTGVLTLNVNANVVPVPEPASYAMLLAGLGLMGGIAHRRRQRSV